ncbi:hypothetical protein, partial [Acinetobacter baumannii]|uniref:hypothetical protein n=1 Tax=Acinetobacter baumannii TaxID=470 RepID=UPI001C0749AF
VQGLEFLQFHLKLLEKWSKVIFFRLSISDNLVTASRKAVAVYNRFSRSMKQDKKLPIKSPIY